MADYSAGGADKLGIVRYGRDLMEQDEGAAAANIYPGEIVTPDGTGGFAKHDGTSGNDVYVAEEARGRGMDAQTDAGYPAGDEMYALRPAGGGLNLMVTAGENVTDGDELAVDTANPGQVVLGGNANAGITVGYADEDADLSGNSDPELVAANME